MFSISGYNSAVSMARDRPFVATLQVAALATSIIFAPVAAGPIAMGSAGFIKGHNYSKNNTFQNLINLFKSSGCWGLLFLAPMPIRAIVTLGYIGWNRDSMGLIGSTIRGRFKSLGWVHKAVALVAATVFTDIALVGYAAYYTGSLLGNLTKKGRG